MEVDDLVAVALAEADLVAVALGEGDLVAVALGEGDLVAPLAAGEMSAAITSSAIRRLISVPLKFTDREEDSYDEPDN